MTRKCAKYRNFHSETNLKHIQRRKAKEEESCLTVGAALEASPSHRRPLQVGLDPRLQAHVLLLHGVEGVAHRVHHLHHVDLAV